MNPPRQPSPKRSSVIVAILLTFLTLGLYVPVWFIQRQRGLDRLNSPVKIGLGLPWLMLVLHVGLFVAALQDAALQQRGMQLPLLAGLAIAWRIKPEKS